MKVYLDNAATTPISKEVLDVMIPIMQNQFGNPSSIHRFGTVVRALVEHARRNVSKLLNCSPGEVFFTSGGTEADNMAIRCAIRDLGIKHAISSKIEHHAVEHTLEVMEKNGEIKLSYVNIDSKGNIDLAHLRSLLASNERSFVSLMHANNEIGTLLPIKKVGELCKEFNAIFHSDTVQTMGHYKIDTQSIHVHFLTCAAHKFHGPKGVGFLYINKSLHINPFIYGGPQERNMRGGTENVYGIVGLSKALEEANKNIEEHQKYISSLKKHMQNRLVNEIKGVEFNGEDIEHSLYTVLNVSFPPSDKGEMLLFSLDIEGIAASGGSACSSGSNVGSHVLNGIGVSSERAAIRFSFSKYNTIEEIDYTVDKLKLILGIK